MHGYHEIDNSLLRRMFTITLDSGFAKVVEGDGFIKGCMFAILSRNNWGIPTASDLICFSSHETHILLKQYKKWAVKVGAKQIAITNSFGNKKFERLIKILGFNLVSNTFNMEI